MSICPLRRLVILFLLFIIVPLGIAAQEIMVTPKLSGVWIPAEKSQGYYRNYRLNITQDAARVVIVKEFEFEKKLITNTFNLFPDGRGERNLVMFAGADDPVEIVSKTEWKKGKLMRKFTHCYSTYISTESVAMCNENTETYSISADGSELTFHGTMRREGRISAGKRKFRKEL